MAEPMRALTLWQPWAWAVAHAGKAVENRTWSPPVGTIGKPLAIHAGLRWDREGYLWMKEQLGIDAGTYHWRGHVVAVATLAGYVWPPSPGPFRAVPPRPDIRSAAASPWCVGPVGWVLSDVVPLPVPVHCKGRQGLWQLPPYVEDDVRRQLEETSR
ncbi:MAG: hypothetical protein ACOC9T_03680 [Myxococcota bacterium]